MALPFQTTQLTIPSEKFGIRSTLFVRAVITAKDNDRIIIKTFLFQLPQDFAYITVETGNHTGKLSMGMFHGIITRTFGTSPGFISEKMLFVSFKNGVIGLCQFRMWKRISEEAIKRLFAILLINPLHGFLMNQIGRILRTLFVIITKHGIIDVVFHYNTYDSGISFLFTVSVQEIGIVQMCLKLTYITVKFIYTPFIRCGAGTFIAARPFTENSCNIAVLLHDFGQNNVVFIIRFLSYDREIFIDAVCHGRNIFPIFFITTHMSMPSVLPGHQRSTGRCTNRTTGISLGKQHTFLRHTVEVGRLDIFLPVTPQVAIAHIIAENENDIRLG